MLLSGPAGGVTGAVWVAEQSGHRDLLTFDMGGTSTDVALVQDLAPSIGRETKVGDLTVRASAVDVRTVGAGGGSIAHVPELTRALRVGPQSAGADPGPAAYGRGGTEPTVTDANVVLGYLPATLAGGEITLDVEAVAQPPSRTVADAMGLSLRAGGRRDHRHRQREHARRPAPGQRAEGIRPPRLRAHRLRRRRTAARQRASGRLTGAWPVIVPPSPGVLCALGRRHHVGARRVRPHPAAPVHRPRRAASCARSSTPWPAQAAERLAQQGIAGARTRPSATRSTCATSARATTSRSTVPDRRPGRADDVARRARPTPFRRRARAAVLLHRSTSTTSWSTPAPRSPARARRSRRRAAGAGTATPPPRGDDHPHLRRRRVRARPRVYDRAKLRAGDVVAGPGDRHRDGLDHPRPARPRRDHAPPAAAC